MSLNLSGHFRCCKCSTESDPRDHVSYGCGGRSHCYCDLPVIIPCILVLGCICVIHRKLQLPGSIWKIKDQYCLLKTEFPGWDSDRIDRAQSLICQMLCFSPRLTPLDRPPWQGIRLPDNIFGFLYVAVNSVHTGVYELYQWKLMVCVNLNVWIRFWSTVLLFP